VHREGKKLSLEKLLKKVEAALVGSSELDTEFIEVLPSVPHNVTTSIHAVVQLVPAATRAVDGTFEPQSDVL
jgi:hypothetical protein